MTTLKVGQKGKKAPKAFSFMVGRTLVRVTAFKTLMVNLALSALTLYCYSAVTVPPEDSLYAPFIAYGIPVLMVVQLAFAVMWGLRGKVIHILFPLITLALGYDHLKATLAFNLHPDVANHDLKVVSYNIRMMQGYGRLREKTREEARTLVNWLTGTSADIICLQEYYNSPNRYGFDFDSVMAEVGLKYHYFSKANRSDWVQGNLGMCIYSKYPIVKTRTLHKDIKRNNQILYADVSTPKGIVRVYNVHLHSLQLKESELDAGNDSEVLKRNAKSVGTKLRKGFLERRLQVRILDSAIEATTLPMLVCGDFNDMPYSYTYHKMRQRLGSAFEDGGSGFDFSFNGKIPFLRIDNQFYSKQFRVLNFETWNDVALSDHFPIVGWYQLHQAEVGHPLPE